VRQTSSKRWANSCLGLLPGGRHVDSGVVWQNQRTRSGMFSSYIAWYLFLGGMGSGAFALASIFNYIGRYSLRSSLREYRSITRSGFILGPALVMLGAVFLVFDLGSPTKAYTIFLVPKLTLLSFGSWSIVLFCLFALLLLFFRSDSLVHVHRFVIRTVEILGLLLSLCVMAYTGLYVSSMPALPFLHTPLITILFVISSLSTGAALITLYGFFNQHRKSMLYGLRIIPRIDLFFIVLEAALLVSLIVSKYFEADIARKSVIYMLFNEGFYVFWIGVILLGIVIPLAISFFSRHHQQPSRLAVSAVLIIVGGLALRFSIIIGGLHIATTQLLALLT
jgi:formate-dependent nitrite reductase membrane component NrfD